MPLLSWAGKIRVGSRCLCLPAQCIGFIIPLMDAMYANYYTREVMYILIREFQTPDEEMKKIVLKVVAQCVGTEGVPPDYIRNVRPSPPFLQLYKALQYPSPEIAVGRKSCTSSERSKSSPQKTDCALLAALTSWPPL